MLSLLGGRPAPARGTIVRHSLADEREERRDRVQRRVVRRQEYCRRTIGTTERQSHHWTTDRSSRHNSRSWSRQLMLVQ